MADRDVRIDLQLNTGEFEAALGRVDQKARGLFVTLRDLSQRYQQQGFLGMSDQRALEQGVRNWERAEQIMRLRVQGAQARLQAATEMGGEGAQLRMTQARNVLEQLTAHQRGLGTLRGAVGNVFGGGIPGSTGAWYPGYGLNYGAAGPPRPAGGFSAWYPGYGLNYGAAPAPGWTRPSGRLSPWYPGYGLNYGMATAGATPPTGGFSPWYPGYGPMQGPAPAPGWARPAGSYSPWYPGYGLNYGPTMTPLQQAHALQFGGTVTSQTPLQQAHAQLLAQQGSQYQAGMQRAQLLSLMAQMGPTASTGGRGGGGDFLASLLGAVIGGGGLGATFGGGLGGAIGGPPGAIIGGALGKLGDRGVAAALGTLPAHAEREVNIMRLGATLDQQFGDLRTTLVDMRREYQVLGIEGVRAMQALARATGQVDRASTMAAIRVGRFYGMTAGESLETLTQFRLAGVAAPDMAGVAFHGERAAARYPGAISAQRFLTETARVAGVGELAAPGLPAPLGARYLEMMQSFGGRYTTQPAQAFLERFQGFQQPRGTLGQVLQVQAVESVRRRQRFVDFHGTTLDLNDPEDFRVAMENIGSIDALEDAVYDTSRAYAGGNPSLTRLYYGAAAGASATRARLETAGMGRYQREQGSVASGLRRPLDAAGAERRLTERQAAERGQVGLEELRARTVSEEIAALPIMQEILKTQLAVANAVGQGAEAYNKGLPFLESLARGMEELTPLLKDFIGSIKATQAGGGLGGALATGVTNFGTNLAEIPNTPLVQMLSHMNRWLQQAMFLSGNPATQQPRTTK